MPSSLAFKNRNKKTKKATSGNYSLLPVITFLAANILLFVIMTHITTFHMTALHIDSADQSQAIDNSSNSKKYLPVIAEIITFLIYPGVAPSPILYFFARECSPDVFYQYSHLSPRAPP